MQKTKILGLALAGILWVTGMTPITAYGKVESTESVTVSEKNQGRDKRNNGFKERMKEAVKAWDSLDDSQRAQIYALLDEEMKLEQQLMDKLVELKVIQSEDGELIKAYMLDKYNKVKEEGKFPLFKQ